MTVVAREAPRGPGEPRVICEYREEVDEYDADWNPAGRSSEKRTEFVSEEHLQHVTRRQDVPSRIQLSSTTEVRLFVGSELPGRITITSSSPIARAIVALGFRRGVVALGSDITVNIDVDLAIITAEAFALWLASKIASSKTKYHSDLRVNGMRIPEDEAGTVTLITNEVELGAWHPDADRPKEIAGEKERRKMERRRQKIEYLKAHGKFRLCVRCKKEIEWGLTKCPSCGKTVTPTEGIHLPSRSVRDPREPRVD